MECHHTWISSFYLIKYQIFSLGRRSANRGVCRITGGLRGPLHQRQVRRKPNRPTHRGSNTRVCSCLKSACQRSHFRRGFVSNTSRNTPQPDPSRHRYDRSTPVVPVNQRFLLMSTCFLSDLQGPPVRSHQMQNRCLLSQTLKSTHQLWSQNLHRLAIQRLPRQRPLQLRSPRWILSHQVMGSNFVAKYETGR